MTIKLTWRGFAALFMCGMTFSASANSISFDMDTYDGLPSDQVTVTVHFGFTDFAMFGGGFNVIYDPNVLQFESYTRNDSIFSGAGAPQASASPIGALESPGNYLGAGVGTFDFYGGITIAGDIGKFVFTVLGAGGDGGCGATLCLFPEPDTNPMRSLAGADVTYEVFANGIWAANILDLTDTDGDGDPDTTDPDDDDDGIADFWDRLPLDDSNANCTTNNGTNATLVGAAISAQQTTCAAKESVDVRGTTNVGINGNLRLISEKVSLTDMSVTDNGRLEVINADPCPACTPP